MGHFDLGRNFDHRRLHICRYLVEKKQWMTLRPDLINLVKWE